MKPPEPTVVQEGAMKSAPDPRRAARLARLAFVAAAAVPSCHRGESPTMTTANAPTSDASTASPPSAPARSYTAEQLPGSDPGAVLPSEQRVAVPPPPLPPSGVIAEARAVPPSPRPPSGLMAELRATPLVGELGAPPHRRPPIHRHVAEARPNLPAEDMDPNLKPTRRER
jgi:hypothetical protein